MTVSLGLQTHQQTIQGICAKQAHTTHPCHGGCSDHSDFKVALADGKSFRPRKYMIGEFCTVSLIVSDTIPRQAMAVHLIFDLKQCITIPSSLHVLQGFL